MAKELTVTHVNIRQSIAIMLAKLFLIDIIATGVVIAIYYLLFQSEEMIQIATDNIMVFPIILGLAGVFKIVVGSFVILSWLNEYYEINSEYIIHKKGIIFKKTEMVDLDKIRAIDIQDSFLGELLNFATITVYEIRLGKIMNMYLIHNPHRYAKVLKDLRPHLEVKKDTVRLPFLPKEEALSGESFD